MFARPAFGVRIDDLRLPVRQALRAAAEMGCSAAEIDAFGAEVAAGEITGTGLRDLAHAIRSAGLTPASLWMDAGGRRFGDRAAMDRNLSRALKAFDMARAIGCRTVTMPLGYIPPKAEDPASALLHQAGTALAAESMTRGVRVALVPCGEPMDVLLKFIAGLDSQGGADIAYDPGAAIKRGLDPVEAAMPLLSRVIQFRGHDAYRGGGEAPMGKGDLPRGELIAVLTTLDRPGPWIVTCERECDREAALRDALAHLGKLAGGSFGPT